MWAVVGLWYATRQTGGGFKGRLGKTAWTYSNWWSMGCEQLEYIRINQAF